MVGEYLVPYANQHAVITRAVDENFTPIWAERADIGLTLNVTTGDAFGGVRPSQEPPSLMVTVRTLEIPNGHHW